MARLFRFARPSHFAEYAAVALISFAAMAIVLKLWAFDITLPNAYYGDGWSYLAVVKGMMENGWTGGVLHITRLGAPTGAMLHDTMVFQQSGMHNVLLHLISFFVPSRNSDEVINIYYFLSYPLISMATYWLLREVPISRIWSFVGAMLFTFSTYHLCRNTVHIYLSVYFMVPLAFLVLLWLAQRRLEWRAGMSWWALWRQPKFRASALILYLLATSDAYYTFFVLALLAFHILLIFYQARPHPLRQVALVLTLMGVIGAGIFTVVAPTFSEKMAHTNPERNIYPLARDYYMADFDTLRMDTMIMPAPAHRMESIRKFITGYQTWLGIRSETISANSGIIPTLGFLLSLAIILFGLRHPVGTDRYEPLRHWSAVNLFMLLLSISGGFGVLIAVVFPEVRCYMRLSLFMHLASLIVFCVVMDRHLAPRIKRRFVKHGRALCMVLAIVLTVFGVWDQTPFTGAYSSGDYSANLEAMGRKNARYEADRSFIAQVENALPPHTMVFELPYVSFWTYNEAVGHIEYDHLLPFLHSRTLRWSYGSLIGTPVDLWQRRVARKPMPDALREMAALGFGAVYVDREGYGDHGASVIAQLSSLLHDQPIVSPDGRRLVFLLPSPGFVLQVDPHRYWPIRMRLTERASITPERLPDYIPPEPLFAWLAAHPRATDIAGDDLDALLDAPMLRQLTGYDDAPLPEAAWRGRIACPAGATITYRPQAPQADYMVPVTVHNDSDVWWNFDGTRNHPLTIRSHLIRADGTMENNDYPYQLFVAAAVPPHRTRTLNATFSATELQSLAGTHLLQLDIMQDGVAWLSGKYAPNTTCNVRIISGEPAKAKR